MFVSQTIYNVTVLTKSMEPSPSRLKYVTFNKNECKIHTLHLQNKSNK